VTEPADFSRRDFLVRAGQYGLAFSVINPRLGDLFRGELVHSVATEDLNRGILTSPVPTDFYSGLRWRMLGPFRGGRVAAATGVPGRPNEFYFGAVNGGVWKTIDGGRVWTPVFDSQPTASIGAIAVAPSQPNTVYVGSGESTLRDSVGFGNGVYKSIDAGKTWTHLGLDETHHIGKIAVDPRNPNNVFVAAMLALDLGVVVAGAPPFLEPNALRFGDPLSADQVIQLVSAGNLGHGVLAVGHRKHRCGKSSVAMRAVGGWLTC